MWLIKASTWDASRKQSHLGALAVPAAKQIMHLHYFRPLRVAFVDARFLFYLELRENVDLDSISADLYSVDAWHYLGENEAREKRNKEQGAISQ